MPLPLIAAAIIVAGGATGGGGLALGGKGALDMKRARKDLQAAIVRYEDSRKKSEARATVTNQRLTDYGSQQEDAIEKVLLRLADFMRRNARSIKENERILTDGLDVTVGVVNTTTGPVIDFGGILGGIVGAFTAGAGTSAAVTGTVGALASASTGAAISGLSGAAAQGATLAWLGGGSLATGGGGMALGATVLNVVTVGPALLVGGLVLKGKGKQAVTEAKSKVASIDIAIAEADLLAARLDAIEARVDELSGVLADLTSRAVVALDELESEDFDPTAHAPRFQRCVLLAQGVRDVAATKVLDDEGDLTDESATIAVKYRTMTKETIDG
ncbi:hypothetical protein ACQ7HM_10470 [Williamsia sp. MIQD14]|uniref:hypothetical protein n=1 Tax=Williamsia sp. MIQD14 TaxID=3425703 RepID=UPI003DA1B6E9